MRTLEEVEAAIKYLPGTETELIRVDSVDALRSDYLSYFADMRASVTEFEKAIA